jgi:hypothetical protein
MELEASVLVGQSRASGAGARAILLDAPRLMTSTMQITSTKSRLGCKGRHATHQR